MFDSRKILRKENKNKENYFLIFDYFIKKN